MSETEGVFVESGKKDWIRAAAKELSDPNPLQKLSFQEGDLALFPYYDASDAPATPQVPVVDHGKPWVNAPKVFVDDAISANEAALRHLEAGADGILFEWEGNAPSPEKLLAGIELGFCSVFFKGNEMPDFLRDFGRYSQSRFDPGQVKGAIYGLSPIDFSVRRSFDGFPQLKTLGVTLTSPCLDSHALAQAFMDIQACLAEDSKASGTARLEPVALLIPISDDFFGEVIRIRAIDRLWSSFSAAYGQTADVLIHCVSKPTSDPAFDPSGNMIASATRAVSAITGGAHVLTVDTADQSPLGVRMARNISFILHEEAQLSKAPAAARGSYFVESAAHQLADKAWKTFKARMGS